MSSEDAHGVRADHRRAYQGRSLLGVIVVSRDQKQAFSHTDENFAKVIALTLSAAFTVCMENEIFEVTE
jgi:hypothetical protein